VAVVDGLTPNALPIHQFIARGCFYVDTNLVSYADSKSAVQINLTNADQEGGDAQGDNQFVQF
jgi:hypothetical protein